MMNSLNALAKKRANFVSITRMQGMGFARYFNKAQQTALDMKTDMTAYEYFPETISRLDPHPNYPERAIDDRYWQWKSQQMSKTTAERLRTGSILKRQNERKYTQGRLFSHIKLAQIKKEV